MLPEFVVFLTLWIADTSYPTMTFLRSFDSVHECNEYKENTIDVEKRSKYHCIKMDVSPDSVAPGRNI